jgi:replication factor C subunit 2/4
MGKLWVDQYRPQLIKDIVQQDDIKQIIEHAINEKNITHMLFYGPPGTGKTTTALALVREMFKCDDVLKSDKLMNERVLELNASDERGIKVVRDKIKTFASASLDTQVVSVPAFKVIILDEADAMTSDSQFALRRIIEKYTTLTRFILICNYVTKIITPLSSRCTKLRFQSISADSLHKIMNRINVELDQDTLQYLYDVSNGDLRKAINIIQRASYISDKITKDTIRDISGQVAEKVVADILLKLQNKNITYQQILDMAKHFCNDGFSSLGLVKDMFDKIVTDPNINDKRKNKLLVTISDIDHYINDNANEYIQIVKLFSYVKSLYQ